jgi:7,8-dihydropterin-6-yl-methyl-4-(beta-D-ribofuranosyl)aminobenzene 5'-phosphate synthase
MRSSIDSYAHARVVPQTIIGTALCVLSLIVLSLAACDKPSADAAASTDLQSTTAARPATPASSTAEVTTQPEATAATETISTSSTEPPIPPIAITDLYDNPALQSSLEGDWGFACLVEGYDQTILFDTGSSGSILLSNMNALGIDPLQIDLVVLSHEHGDHTRGLAAVLAQNSEITVYCPASFSQSFIRSAEAAGATLVRVDSATSPCQGVTITTPVRGGSVNEQGLLLETAQGPVLITGCAHPGIVAMAEAATALADQPLLAVFGGFHLRQHSDRQVQAVIGDLQQLGIQQCGPTHCTGDRAIALFQEAFGPGFIPMGVGKTLQF